MVRQLCLLCRRGRSLDCGPTTTADIELLEGSSLLLAICVGVTMIFSLSSVVFVICG